MNGTFNCPICGKDTPHQHTSEEFVAHRNTQKRESLRAELLWTVEQGEGKWGAVRSVAHPTGTMHHAADIVSEHNRIVELLLAVAANPASSVADASGASEARDAARYRWLVKNCFDWAAPGDGDSFDHIELHFESNMLSRDDESVGCAIDAEIAKESGND